MIVNYRYLICILHQKTSLHRLPWLHGGQIICFVTIAMREWWTDGQSYKNLFKIPSFLVYTSYRFVLLYVYVKIAENQKCLIDKMSADLQQESSAHQERLQSISELYENQLHDNATAMNQLTVGTHFLQVKSLELSNDNSYCL